MLSTTQDPNTSNLAVSIRVSYRLPAYGRLCLELVHSADSLLINMYLFYSNYRVNQSDTLSLKMWPFLLISIANMHIS